MKKYIAHWGDGYGSNQCTKVVSRTSFSDDNGYSVEDLKEIDDLSIHETHRIDAPEYHTITRIQDEELEISDVDRVVIIAYVKVLEELADKYDMCLPDLISEV